LRLGSTWEASAGFPTSCASRTDRALRRLIAGRSATREGPTPARPLTPSSPGLGFAGFHVNVAALSACAGRGKRHSGGRCSAPPRARAGRGQRPESIPGRANSGFERGRLRGESPASGPW